MRSVGLDVHRDVCEVAIADERGLRSAGRVETTPQALQLLAESLGADDQVALEATGNVLAIAAILHPHVGRVVLANPAAVRGELNAPKTDKIDARSLARLLATGFLPEVWAPDPETAALRGQLARRRQLVKQRTGEKNQVHAVLQRNLKRKPPASDLFGAQGRGLRRWGGASCSWSRASRRDRREGDGRRANCSSIVGARPGARSGRRRRLGLLWGAAR